MAILPAHSMHTSLGTDLRHRKIVQDKGRTLLSLWKRAPLIGLQELHKAGDRRPKVRSPMD